MFCYGFDQVINGFRSLVVLKNFSRISPLDVIACFSDMSAICEGGTSVEYSLLLLILYKILVSPTMNSSPSISPIYRPFLV